MNYSTRRMNILKKISISLFISVGLFIHAGVAHAVTPGPVTVNATCPLQAGDTSCMGNNRPVVTFDEAHKFPGYTIFETLIKDIATGVISQTGGTGSFFTNGSANNGDTTLNQTYSNIYFNNIDTTGKDLKIYGYNWTLANSWGSCDGAGTQQRRWNCVRNDGQNVDSAVCANSMSAPPGDSGSTYTDNGFDVYEQKLCESLPTNLICAKDDAGNPIMTAALWKTDSWRGSAYAGYKYYVGSQSYDGSVDQISCLGIWDPRSGGSWVGSSLYKYANLREYWGAPFGHPFNAPNWEPFPSCPLGGNQGPGGDGDGCGTITNGHDSIGCSGKYWSGDYDSSVDTCVINPQAGAGAPTCQDAAARYCATKPAAVRDDCLANYCHSSPTGPKHPLPLLPTPLRATKVAEVTRGVGETVLQIQEKTSLFLSRITAKVRADSNTWNSSALADIKLRAVAASVPVATLDTSPSCIATAGATVTLTATCTNSTSGVISNNKDGVTYTLTCSAGTCSKTQDVGPQQTTNFTLTCNGGSPTVTKTVTVDTVTKCGTSTGGPNLVAVGIEDQGSDNDVLATFTNNGDATIMGNNSNPRLVVTWYESTDGTDENSGPKTQVNSSGSVTPSETASASINNPSYGEDGGYLKACINAAWDPYDTPSISPGGGQPAESTYEDNCTDWTHIGAGEQPACTPYVNLRPTFSGVTAADGRTYSIKANYNAAGRSVSHLVAPAGPSTLVGYVNNFGNDSTTNHSSTPGDGTFTDKFDIIADADMNGLPDSGAPNTPRTYKNGALGEWEEENVKASYTLAPGEYVVRLCTDTTQKITEHYSCTDGSSWSQKSPNCTEWVHVTALDMQTVCSPDNTSVTLSWSAATPEPVSFGSPAPFTYNVRLNDRANDGGGRWYISDPPDKTRDGITTTSVTYPVVQNDLYQWWFTVPGIGGYQTSDPMYSTFFTCGPPAPDLTASNLVAPATTRVGVVTPITVDINNIGNLGTGSAFANTFLFSSNPNGTGARAFPSVPAGPLGAQSTQNITFNASFPNEGTFYLRTCADRPGTITEPIESNNCTTGQDNVWGDPIEVKAPDLIASDVTPSTATIGSSQTFTATITNQGTITTGAGFANRFQIASSTASGTADPNKWMEIGVRSFAQGLTNDPTSNVNQRTVSLAYTYTDLTKNSPWMRVCADLPPDPDGVIFESNSDASATDTGEDNNCSSNWVKIILNPGAAPDLTAAWVTPTPTTMIAGQSNTISAAITNQGAAATGAGFPNVLRMASSTGTRASNGPRDDFANSLGAGAAPRNAVFRFTPPSGDVGKHYFFQACADQPPQPNGVISETNASDTGETNNCTPGWIDVTIVGPTTSAPDLTVPSQTATKSTDSTRPYDWSFTATITNQSTIATGAGFTDKLQVAQDNSPKDGLPDTGTIVQPTSPTDSAHQGMLFSNPALTGQGGTKDSVSASFTYTLPAVAGNYIYRICADLPPDPNGVIDERTNEDNNCYAAGINGWSPFPPAVTCSPNPSSVSANANVVWTPVVQNFTSTPTYKWSAPGSTFTSDTNNPFTNKYAAAGKYTVHVTATAGAQSADANCRAQVTVTDPPTVTCTVPNSNVNVGSSVTVSATASNFSSAPTWAWTAPGGNPSAFNAPAGNSSAFRTAYNSPGTYRIDTQATAGSQKASCSSPVDITVRPAPACGSANGVFTPTPPNSALCSVGNGSNVSQSGTNWTWTCTDSVTGVSAPTCTAPGAGSTPDLVLGAITPTTASAGQVQTYTIRVTNQGTAPTGQGFNVTISQSANSWSITKSVGALAANGGFQDISFSKSFTAGTKTLVGTADSDNVIDEGTTGGESNNTRNYTLTINGVNGCGTAADAPSAAKPAANLCASGYNASTVSGTASGANWTWTCTDTANSSNVQSCSAPVAKPDLIVTDFDPLTAQQGEATTYTVKVKNVGTADMTRSFPIQIAWQTTEPQIQNITNVPKLAIGETTSQTFAKTFVVINTPRSVIVTADVDNVIDELDETNNIANYDVAVSYIDLTPGPIDQTQLPAGSGTISATIFNEGTRGTGAGFTNLLQKANDTSGTGAADVATKVFGLQVGAGASRLADFANVPIALGDNYFRVCADKAKGTDVDPVAIDEWKESNNCGAWLRVVGTTGPGNSCGTADGAAACSLSSSSSGLCGAGINATGFTGSGPWTWSCGSSSCSAPKDPDCGGGGAYMTCSNDAGGPNITPPDTVTFTAVAHDGAHANYTFDDTYGPGKVGSSLTYTQDYTTADSGKDVAVTVAAANATTPVACGTALHVNTTTNSCGVTLEPIITPDDPRVTPGGSTVIRWHNDNAASCTISRNGVSNWANTSGCVVDDSKTDSGISAATTYCITCDNDTGNTACTTVNVGGLEFEEF